MPGGPIGWFSSMPGPDGVLFPNVHIGATNGRLDFGMGAEASLAPTGTWHLRGWAPEVLPSGTPTLNLVALAFAVTGAAKVNPTWAMCSETGKPDTIGLNAEGTQTLTWVTGDKDRYKQLEVTLDADTVVASEIFVVDLVFESTAWTLTAVSTWQAAVYWK